MSEVGIKTTRDRLVQIITAEPKKYSQAELGRMLGVSRERAREIVKRLDLGDLVRAKHWSFYCLDCGKPIYHGAIRCRQCSRAKRVTLTCDFCGKQFERKESEARRHKKHFCSTNCRNRYGALYKWTPSGLSTKLAKLAKRVSLTCDFCGKQFERKESEARRYKKHFCSRSCSRNYARDYGFGAGKAREKFKMPEPSPNGRKLRTRVFELYNEDYSSLVQVAQAMGIANSQIYRVRDGKRSINEKFIVGALKAFPGYKLGELFYVVPDNNNSTG